MAGTFVLISSPSGGGKNTVIHALMARIPHSAQVVTTTTRPPREGEVHCRDYFFVSREAFEDALSRGDMLEYNSYAGNLYGTARTHAEEMLARHAVVFSQADVNGKHSLDTLAFPHIAVFLLPESLQILADRIRARGGVDDASLKERLRIAEREVELSVDYDFRVVNFQGKLTETTDQIIAFLAEQGLRVEG
jgi:guanylate kinase